MFDIFLKEDIHKLLKKKSVVFLGDSNVRALYKDCLCLMQDSQFISDHILKTKMENTVFADKLVYHGERTNARCYREEREAVIRSTQVFFFFLTKIYDDYVKEVLKKITTKTNPDVIVVNSCLWDITRWGCDGVKHFKENLKSLMNDFKILLPDSLIIWVTAPPIACELKGGFLVKELNFLKYSLRFHVVEANHYARKVVKDSGFDVLDTHYHLHMQIHRRCKDGIHWLPKAVRYLTNLLLRHLSLAWDVALPHRYEYVSVDENLLACEDTNNFVSLKAKEKENADEVEEVCPAKSVAPLKSNDVIKIPEGAEEKVSVPQFKKSRKESIHIRRVKNNKKARSRRILRWKQRLIDNPQAACSSNAASFGISPVFNPYFQPSFPYQRFADQNVSPNPNYLHFPAFNFHQPGSRFMNSAVNNFRGQSHFQNYGVPYVFPPVASGQLQPNFCFSNDEIPPIFQF